jgi:hypothetical protein
MKKISVAIGFVAVIVSATACNNISSEKEEVSDTATVTVNSDFKELETGQPVELLKDEETGYVLNATTGEPVEFYINMNTMDTFYGRTGTVVNNAIMQNETGYYVLDEDKIRWEDDSMKVVDNE